MRSRLATLVNIRNARQERLFFQQYQAGLVMVHRVPDLLLKAWHDCGGSGWEAGV